MYRYETHLHTFPVSGCASVSIREYLELYKKLGYDGVFVTNHFLDGNINIGADVPYEDRINFYFSDFEDGIKYGKELEIKVFCGVEMSYRGTDFLVYGLDKEWYLKNPQIMDMKKSRELELLMESGALVIQAHPFREAQYIDHIRLFPRCVHGVEIINAHRSEPENKMAQIYAKNYETIEFAGTDIHHMNCKTFAGMESQRPIESEKDFVNAVKNGEMHPFSITIE